MEDNWGKISNINWIKGEMHDKDCNVVTCSQCDKAAIGSAFGIDQAVHWCREHSLIDAPEAEFVYRVPDEAKVSNEPVILNDHWTVNLKD